MSFSSYLHHQFFNRLRLRAGHHQIPAQQQAVTVSGHCNRTDNHENGSKNQSRNYGRQREVYEINSIAFGQENEAKLVDLLRDSEAFIPELSLVATVDSKLVGHILFSKIVIVDENQNEFESLSLAPMAVRPEFQKKGIGGQLIKNGLDKARELGYTSVIVLGHERYYPKFGFVPTDKWNIKAPFDVPANVFMGLELLKGGLKGVSGMVKYPKEFEAE